MQYIASLPHGRTTLACMPLRFGASFGVVLQPDVGRIGRDFVDIARIASPSDHENSVSIAVQNKAGIRRGEYALRKSTSELEAQIRGERSAPYSPSMYFLEDPRTRSLFFYMPGSHRDSPLVLFDTHMDMVMDGFDTSTKRIHVVEESTEDGDTIYHSKDYATSLGGDAKTSIASSLEMMRLLGELPPGTPHAACILVVSRCEEGGTNGGATEMSPDYLRYGGRNPDIIVALDYQGDARTIVHAAPDFDIFQASIKGQSGHSAMQAQPNTDAASPVKPMAQWVAQFPIGMIAKGTVANIGGIDSQAPRHENKSSVATPIAENAYPAFQRAIGEIRSHIPGYVAAFLKIQEWKFDEIIKQYNEGIQKKAKHFGIKKPALVEGTFTPLHLYDRFNSPKTGKPGINDLKRVISNVYNDRLDNTPTFVKVMSLSDASAFHSKFLNELKVNIPTYVLGSGYQNAHSRRETASLNAMVKLAKVQLDFLVEMGKVTSPGAN